jgi:prepilin-type processing-associated H-X9-DG protein
MNCPICGEWIEESTPTCDKCGQDARFTVRSPDGATYGPYTMGDIRLYAQQGRIAPGAQLDAADGTGRSLAEAGIGVAPPVAPAPARGGGMSTAATCGIVAAVVAVVLIPMIAVLAAILFPVFGKAREKAQQASCMSNIKQLCLGCLQYAQANGNRLPDAATWKQDIQPYVGGNPQLFECPSSKLGQNSYEFNAALSGASIAQIQDPANTPMIYEAGSASGGGPHNGGANVGYADGHVKWTRSMVMPQGAPTAPMPPVGGMGP